MPTNPLGYSCIEKLQRDNLLHAYDEPMNIYSDAQWYIFNNYSIIATFFKTTLLLFEGILRVLKGKKTLSEEYTVLSLQI